MGSQFNSRGPAAGRAYKPAARLGRSVLGPTRVRDGHRQCVWHRSVAVADVGGASAEEWRTEVPGARGRRSLAGET
jgi:hypothetical protein